MVLRSRALRAHKELRYNAPVQSDHRALALCIKLFGEQHEITTYRYSDRGVTQHAMHDYKAAFQSSQRALAIRIKLFIEEHESTAHSYGTSLQHITKCMTTKQLFSLSKRCFSYTH